MMRKIRALVLEDNPDEAELMLYGLERAGYDCTWRRVDRPESFRAALEEDPWDVILADFKMPHFSAPAALEVLRASGKDIPFIIVSGSIGEAIAVEAMKAGAHDFFVKSNLTRLGAAIEREMREAQVRHERQQAVAELRRAEERHRLLVERLVDDLRQAVQARDEFLSIASHELKTPLTSMGLQLESLRKLRHKDPEVQLSDDKVARKLDTIERQSQRLTLLINNLLNVTRITSGRLELRPEKVDLRTLVDDVVARMREWIDRAGCQISFHAQDGVVGVWDRVHLETAVENLLSNATKFGAGKPIGVTIERDASHARLHVRDRGIGISSEQRARVFERFERAVPEHHYGGLGLGLWTVRQIVEAHGGAVRVDSKTGEGSTFTLELPFHLEARP
jgi:signal transduction histidine kinase